MPVYLRRFYYQKLVEVKKKETKQIEKSRNTMTENIRNSSTIPKPVSRFKR